MAKYSTVNSLKTSHQGAIYKPRLEAKYVHIIQLSHQAVLKNSQTLVAADVALWWFGSEVATVSEGKESRHSRFSSNSFFQAGRMCLYTFSICHTRTQTRTYAQHKVSPRSAPLAGGTLKVKLSTS